MEIYKEQHYITGANGFFGKHLSSILDDVTVGDRETTTINSKHIVDLAAYGNLAWQTDTEEIYKANYERPKKIIEDSTYDSLILTSTTSLQLPVLTDYAKSKGMIEEFAITFAKENDKPIVVYRPASVTGVGEQEKHLIPRLIRSCLYGEEMDFVEEPVHDFIDVEDVVDAILFMEENIDKCKGQVFNVSNNKGYSNKQIREIVESILGMKANARIVESLRDYDTTDWVVDNSKLLDLGWRPQKTIEESICEMIQSELSKDVS